VIRAHVIGVDFLRLAALTAGMLLLASCSDRDPAASGPQASQSAVPTSAPLTKSPLPRKLTDQEQARLNTRLIDAAWVNDVATARRLVVAGANVNAQDRTQQSAYLIATSEGYLRLLDLTLNNGADVAELDSFNGTGLIRAAERGHANIVGRLLQTRVKVDHVNNLGWTALHEAIVLGDGSQPYVDTVRLLVAGGADIALPPVRDGILPVDHARSRGFNQIVRTLEGAKTPVDKTKADQALIRAARDGDPDLASRALAAGANVEARDAKRRTALLVAVAEDHVPVARLLVALGADPDALDDQHDTPWLVTGVTGSVAMLEVLLPAKPDLTIRNRFGGISVIPASERGHVDYVRRVVETEIDVNHVNDLGWTALLEAVILGDGSNAYQQIVRILLVAGADPTIGDNEGVTAVQHARRSGQREVARILGRG
jgi:uncharacterized protein